MPQLIAVILTLNEVGHIAECISSLDWADRVVLFDSGSDDGTVPAAEAAGAEIGSRPFDNYAAQRNAALDFVAAHPAQQEGDKDCWVLFVDADERGTPALGAEIRSVIAERPESGWYVPRHNIIFGRLTLGAGWYPDYQLRLLRLGRARYTRPVHEIAKVDGATGHLNNYLLHYNYRDPAHFHAKQRTYVAHDAAILKAEGVRPKPRNYILQPLRQFYWRYVVLKGYRDGLHGLRLSLYMSYYEWRKYRLLADMWRMETADHRRATDGR